MRGNKGRPAPARVGASLICGAALCLLGACRDEKACLGLRTEGFEVINAIHTCTDDTDCRTSVWPACGKPLNAQSEAKLRALEGRSDEAGCPSEAARCEVRQAAFCDRNFCVVRATPVAP